MPRLRVRSAFRAWSECARTLADNPLVLLHGDAADLLVSASLVVLRKLAPADRQPDEALRHEFDVHSPIPKSSLSWQ